MDQHLTLNFNKPIPLFPLPGCVLLPHATIPLQFFEPRYVKMAADTLADNRLICTATFQGSAWMEHYNESPPVHPGVCVGFIVEDHQLDDGRYHVLVQGLCRARMISELPDEDLPYRKAFLEPVDIEPHDEEDFADIRPSIDEMLTSPLLEQLTAIRAMRRWHDQSPNTPALVDVGTMTLCQDTALRYQMLHEPCAYTRAKTYESLLRQTMRTMQLAQRHTPEDLTDHMHVN